MANSDGLIRRGIAPLYASVVMLLAALVLVFVFVLRPTQGSRVVFRWHNSTLMVTHIQAHGRITIHNWSLDRVRVRHSVILIPSNGTASFSRNNIVINMNNANGSGRILPKR